MRVASRSSLWVGLAWLTSLLGCAAGPGASLPALQHRAVFDLGCPAHALQLHHIDRRTKAVMGCGRRLIYVESCESRGMDRACTWLLDTPSYVQQTWPHLQPPPPAPAVARPTPSPAPTSAATAPAERDRPRGRPIRTDLDGEEQSVIDSRGEAHRPVETDLFDEDDQARILEHRR